MAPRGEGAGQADLHGGAPLVLSHPVPTPPSSNVPCAALATPMGEASCSHGLVEERAAQAQASLCLDSHVARQVRRRGGHAMMTPAGRKREGHPVGLHGPLKEESCAARGKNAWQCSAARFWSPWLVLPLVILGMACALQGAGAQQAPPLQGQGITPQEAGLLSFATPVFMSVEVLKLLSLDAQEYQFGAILQFQQSWFDPRAHDIFDIIDTQFLAALDAQSAFAECETTKSFRTSDTAVLNLTSDACTAALPKPPDCKKFCTSYGTGLTDSPFRCCDALWLPDVRLRNLLYTSQDRIATDTIWPFFNQSGVHRETQDVLHRMASEGSGGESLNDALRACLTGELQVLAQFSTPLQFRAYPFDRQKLQVFVDPNYNAFSKKKAALLEPPFFIVPSGVFRRLNQQLSSNGTRMGTVAGLSKDELAGWQIDNITFACTGKTADGRGNASDRLISISTQSFDPDDFYNQYYFSLFGQDTNPSNLLVQSCALTIDVSRLSSTVVVQSIIPVAFIGLLSFVAFFAELDDLEVRLGTEVSLFLALTAVQFIFTSVLPVTSYLTNFDVFILMSYCLIMAIVIENLAVVYIYTRVDHHMHKGYLDSEGAIADPSWSTSRNGAPAGSGANDDHAVAANELGSLEEAASLAPTQEVTGDGLEGGASGGNAEEHADGPAPPKESSSRKGSYRIPVARFSLVEQRWVKDKKYAYRVASWIDITSGIVLFVTYVILGIINFTLGLT